MESVDRLLAERKAEYQASQKQADELKSQPLVQAQAPLKQAAVPSNPTFKTSEINLYAGALDKDLAQIKAEYEAQNKAQEVASLEPLKAEYKAQSKVQEVASLEPQPAEKVAAPQLDRKSGSAGMPR